MLPQQVTPTTRISMVQAHCQAMSGDLHFALQTIDQTVRREQKTSSHLLDLVALGLLKAELLYLDCRGEEAVAVFESLVQPVLASTTVSEEIRFIVEKNQKHLQIQLFNTDAVGDFYRLYDCQQMAKFDPSDFSKFVAAQEAASQDKHFNAVSELWSEFVRSYRNVAWQSYRLAARALAEEYLLIGYVQEAAHYSVIALDSKLAAKVGNALVRSRNKKATSAIIKKILLTANLQRHFAVVSEIILHLGDALPAELLQSVMEWLTERARIIPQNPHTQQTLNASWKALEVIAPMFDSNQARIVVNAAVQHKHWQTPMIEREQMVKVINRCVPSLRKAELQKLAFQVLPLAVKTRDDKDYASVINLLCRIAERGNTELRKQLGAALFPKDTGVPALLAQVAPLFKKNITDVNQLIRAAKKTAEDVRLQVQRIPLAQEPISVSGAVLIISQELDTGQKLIVSITNPTGLAAMAVHRQRIPADIIKLLIDSMLEMIEEPENSLSNKAALIGRLADFGDSLTNFYLNRILKVLLPLARGEIIEPSYSNSTDDQDPLNRYRIKAETPAEVQAISIYTLVRLDNASRGYYGAKLNEIIEVGLRSPTSQIRRAAFAAAREIRHVPKPVFTALLLGTRDSDPSAAAVAYNALATKRKLRLTYSEWQLVAYSLDIARQSPEVRVRRAAASVVSNFIRQTEARQIISTLRRLQKEFADDVSWSVRKAANNRQTY